jgi:hypothetical protein
LEGAVVFVSNCWLAADDGRPGPMLQALMQARPRAIIGGGGPNYALPGRLAGTDLLALYVRVFLQLGFCVQNALSLAKFRLRIRRQDKATTDTLAFRLWDPKEINSA